MTDRRFLVKRTRPIPKPVLEAIERLQASAKSRRRVGDPTFTELHVSGIVVTDEGYRLLGEAIARNTFLKHLIMPDCYLSEQGALYLFEGIAKNSSLVSINLGENELTESAVLAFITMLKIKTNITDVYLDWGVTNDAMKAEINAILSTRVGGCDGAHHTGFRGRRISSSSSSASSTPQAKTTLPRKHSKRAAQQTQRQLEAAREVVSNQRKQSVARRRLRWLQQHGSVYERAKARHRRTAAEA
eukprot:TRINITY_DN12667_c0_g1_i1.p1 TRINITY_DN12667_c0_g1~~TRINITY_DN12667_c0_g1_i1.p1  ORF type:complete len:244 (+),score=46.46 TRINITY_DN12667_c0_g1_i1:115-846(+)